MAGNVSILQNWVKVSGGTIRVSKMLGVKRSAVYAWMDKSVLPRPVVMQRIVRASKGKVSYDALIDSYRGAKSAKKGKRKAGKGSKIRKLSKPYKAKAVKVKKRLH
jgi:hypothetical protein